MTRYRIDNPVTLQLILKMYSRSNLLIKRTYINETSSFIQEFDTNYFAILLFCKLKLSLFSQSYPCAQGPDDNNNNNNSHNQE